MPSAFTPTVLTISSGGSGAGEISAVTNSQAASDTSGWTNTTRVTSGGPLDPLITTAFSISNTAGAESSTSGGYASFTMPVGLRQRKLKVEFYFTTPATDVYRVSVYKGGTRVPLTTDSSSVTTLPASVTGGKFVGYFDTDGTTSWTVNVTRTSGTTGACLITNVIVGPGIQPQGAVVGEWQSFTPTFNNVSVTNQGSYWRRVGSEIEIKVQVVAASDATGGVTWNLAGGLTGITPDTTKFGNVQALGAGVAILGVNNYSIVPQYNNVAYQTQFLIDGTGVALDAGNPTADGGFDTTDRLTFTVSYPVAEWAGSGTVNLAQNDVEYAYNTSTSTSANDLTSFGYGPQGAQIQSITAGLVRRVRFQTPIQTGDQITLEYSIDRLKWVAADNGFSDNTTFTITPYTLHGGTVYGAGALVLVNSTDVSVNFGTYSGPGGTYNGAGSAWSFASAVYWRVRKSSAGAAVGFGLATTTSSGLIGTGVQSFAGAKTFTTFPTFSTQSLVRVTNSAGTNIVNNTPTKVPFATEVYDVTNEWDTGTSRFTAANAGHYRITCMLRLSSTDTWNVGEGFAISLYRNGSSVCELGVTECWSSSAVTNGVHAAGSTTLNLSAADYLEIFATQDRGGDLALNATASKNWLCIERVA